MKNLTDDQLDHEIDLISNMNHVQAPDFFYTRLRTKMQKEASSFILELPLKPIVVIGTLAFFLFLNSMLLKNDVKNINANASLDMEAFAASYDQFIYN